METTDVASKGRRGRWFRHGRAWAFRVAALLAGLAPLIVCEGLLWSLDLGRPDLSDDPFVGFSTRWPLFVPDATGANQVIPPSHFKFFRPATFPTVKPPGEFRVFVLGGSTVQGRPFATETAFTTWMEIGLNALDPSKTWRVVNCGGVSYASYRLAPILEELLNHQPDLFLICTGHNEFLEERTYAAIKRIPRFVRTPLALASRLRTYQALQGLVTRRWKKPAPPDQLGPEVDALLDHEGGLESYHRDDPGRDAIVDHFAFNLRRMIQTARKAGVPVVLINPVSNLDTPPFKSEHRDGLSASDLATFNRLLEEARARYATDLPRAVARLEEALAIDDRHAGMFYNLGKCYQSLGRADDARRAFLIARDEDVCPLRILSSMNQVIRDVAEESGTPWFDADVFFAERSRDGIPGGEWLVDHVHPSINGHRMWADALIALLAREGYAKLDQSRQPKRDRLERAHLDSLDATYYLIGQKRLGNLRLWAAGRGNLPPSRKPSIGTQNQTTARPPTELDHSPPSD